MVTVWVNGCFDVIHRGHIELFQYARSLGDKLIVGLDSDQKVKQDKGRSRPYNCLADRIFTLNSIKYIDEVKSFNSKEGLENLIKELKPDILVVGSDWKGKEVVGGKYAKNIRYFNRIGNYSTTAILTKNDEDLYF
jgi:D-beta-D-heptose 7-phosphate kinase/D-beta-D-heptose 1-phosphate adenosyltransferase